jgi:hypothetical protein
VRLLRRAERRRRLLRRAEPTESTERHRDRASRRADARVAIRRARRKSHASAPRACDLCDLSRTSARLASTRDGDLECLYTRDETATSAIARDRSRSIARRRSIAAPRSRAIDRSIDRDRSIAIAGARADVA